MSVLTFYCFHCGTILLDNTAAEMNLRIFSHFVEHPYKRMPNLFKETDPKELNNKFLSIASMRESLRLMGRTS